MSVDLNLWQQAYDRMQSSLYGKFLDKALLGRDLVSFLLHIFVTVSISFA